jgi:hypothetical protein
MAFYLLKILSVGVVATLILFTLGAVPSRAADPAKLPTKAHPLFIDLNKKQVLLYTEVNPKNRDKTNPHWGVVYQGGKLSDKAILSAFCTPGEFHAALMQIGARPGNNLTLDQTDTWVEGDELSVSVLLPGLNKSFSLTDIIFDQTGKGFHIRFGGNLERAAKEKTGCITCLESCPVGITSNAAYPTISSWKRVFSPNSVFKGKKEILSAQDGAPVILIYQLISSNKF